MFDGGALSDFGSEQGAPPVEMSPKKFAKLQNLASKNFSRFAMEVQHVSEQVQLKLIENLPEFRSLASDAIANAEKAFEATLKSNDESDAQLHDAFNQWRDSLRQLLSTPDLTHDQQLLITREIGRTVELQMAKNSEAKAFKAKLYQQWMIGAVVIVGAVVVAVAGGKLALEQAEDDDA